MVVMEYGHVELCNTQSPLCQLSPKISVEGVDTDHESRGHKP